MAFNRTRLELYFCSVLLKFQNSIPAAMRYPHTASLLVNVGSSAQFLIFFAPDTARRSQAQLKVAVISNQYEDSIVQLVRIFFCGQEMRFCSCYY